MINVPTSSQQQTQLMAVLKFMTASVYPSQELIQQIKSVYSPDTNIMPTIPQVEIKYPQHGHTDCGIYAIAYATELAFGHDPTNFTFDQSQLRDHLLHCLRSRTITRFPKKEREMNHEPLYKEITANHKDSEKWNIPLKHQNQQHLKENYNVKRS